MANIPQDPAFYERLLAALDTYRFAGSLVAIVSSIAIVSWAWQRRGRKG